MHCPVSYPSQYRPRGSQRQLRVPRTAAWNWSKEGRPWSAPWRAVFEHMTQPLIVEKLRTIYEETFRECEAHRTAEIGVNCNVCGIVIHAAASLLDADVLVHWEAEDGKMEWMLGLCSLQKRVWGSCQITLRFLGNHVDFICRMKSVSFISFIIGSGGVILGEVINKRSKNIYWQIMQLFCWGKGRSLTIGLIRAAFLVLILATRATSSLPWYNSMIRARGHCKSGVLSSAKNTISPILGALQGSFHFEQVCSWLRRYSFFHRFQNWFRNCCTSLNLLSLVSFGDSKVSGSAFGLQPIKKCPGVRGSKSFGSELMGDIGLELRIASTSVTRVWNSSKVKTVVPMTLFKCFLAALTPASQSPPKWGALGGIMFHWVPSSAANWEIEFRFLESVSFNFSNSFLAPTKLVPLSDSISWGTPRLATKRFRTTMQAVVLKSEATSRCIAFVARQTSSAK